MKRPVVPYIALIILTLCGVLPAAMGCHKDTTPQETGKPVAGEHADDGGAAPPTPADPNAAAPGSKAVTGASVPANGKSAGE